MSESLPSFPQGWDFHLPSTGAGAERARWRLTLEIKIETDFENPNNITLNFFAHTF